MSLHSYNSALFLSGGIQAFPANLTMIGFLDLQPSTMINLPDRCFICKEQKQSKNKLKDYLINKQYVFFLIM
jgi:hypothetical protein